MTDRDSNLRCASAALARGRVAVGTADAGRHELYCSRPQDLCGAGFGSEQATDVETDDAGVGQPQLIWVDRAVVFAAGVTDDEHTAERVQHVEAQCPQLAANGIDHESNRCH